MEKGPARVWMSADTRRKSRYAFRTLGGSLGIAALALGLLLGGTVLALRLGLSPLWPALGLCLGGTALVLALAPRLGRRALGDATVFYLTPEDRLFAADARRLAPGQWAAAPFSVQTLLRTLRADPLPPPWAEEILAVERLQAEPPLALCQVRCPPNGRPRRRSLFLAPDMEDRELLLRQLERRAARSAGPELRESRRGLHLLGALLALGLLAALCVLSHPAVARLPQALYFPCLAGAYAGLGLVVWLAMRLRQGL